MKAMMSLLVGRNRGKAVCILAWQLTKVAAMADVFSMATSGSTERRAAASLSDSHLVREIEREGCEEVESGQGKYTKQASALDLILRLNNHRSYSDSHNQRGIYFLECTVSSHFRTIKTGHVRYFSIFGKLEESFFPLIVLSHKVTNLTKLTEAQTDEIVLAEKEEIHKVTRASKHLTDQVTDLRSKLKSGTVNLENKRHKISMIKHKLLPIAILYERKKFAATRDVSGALFDEILEQKGLWHHMSIQRRQENAE
ncbi:hypothetical protein Tco_0378020 [Tanacetum coccineum]